jgi:hypothetical protein
MICGRFIIAAALARYINQPPGALNTDPEPFQPVFAEIGKWFVLISS